MEQQKLKDLIIIAKDKMRECGYSDKTIYSAYSYIWEKLCKYSSPDIILNEEVIKQFLLDYFKKDLYSISETHLLHIEKMYLKSFSILLMVKNNEEIKSIKKEQYILNERLKSIFENFLDMCVNNNNNCNRTIENKKKIIKLFIERANFNEPTRDNIEKYLCSLKNKKTITNIIDNRIIYNFLKYCFEKKYINLNILRLWPTSFPNRTNSNIPSEYSEQELNKLLTTAFNFKNEDCHLRNYSILCLIIFTGLRASDVVNLTYNNINWSENIVSIIQQKTLKEIKYPLIPQIGNPLINYIIKERPKTSISNIFVTEKGTVISSQIITSIINRYFAASDINIENKHYGAHSLRHSYASNLINHGVPVYNIAKALGHSDTRTVSIYSKVNLECLRKCVLEDLYE